MAAVCASRFVKRFEATRAVDGAELVVERGEVRGRLFVIYGCLGPLEPSTLSSTRLRSRPPV